MDIDSMPIGVKAKLLDTLLNCQRIRVLGTAREGEKGKEGKIRHIGLELWTEYPENDDSKSREILMNFLTKQEV